MPDRRRAYDHRLRALACEEGDARLFDGLGVPRSMAMSWLRRGPRAVVTLNVVTKDLHPGGAAKAKLLAAIARARASLPLAVALRVLGLSQSRYHAWSRPERVCQLDDLSSCPRTTPT